MNALTSSRRQLCPNDDSHMEITSAYESDDALAENEWVIWACPDRGCSQGVVQMRPDRPLVVSEFITPRTMGRYDIDADRGVDVSATDGFAPCRDSRPE